MVSTPKKLRRLVGVLHNLELVERAKVSELTREIAELRAAQQEILESLEEPTAFHGRFIGLLSGRVGSLERRLQKLSKEREIALQQYADAARRQRSAADMLADARTNEAREQEQKELKMLLESRQASALQARGKSRRSI
jgi:hypothetical protein